MIDIDFDRYSNEEWREIFSIAFWYGETEYSDAIHDYLMKNDTKFSDFVIENREILNSLSESEITEVFELSSQKLKKIMTIN